MLESTGCRCPRRQRRRRRPPPPPPPPPTSHPPPAGPARMSSPPSRGFRASFSVVVVLAVVLLLTLTAPALGVRLLSLRPSHQSVERAIDIHPQHHQKMRKKPCSVKGTPGRCMFVWECMKSEGTHLGICTDRYMFGSCCAHDPASNAIDGGGGGRPPPPHPAPAGHDRQPAPSSSSLTGEKLTTSGFLTGLLASRPSPPTPPSTSVAVFQQAATSSTTTTTSTTSSSTSGSASPTQRPPYHATTSTTTRTPYYPGRPPPSNATSRPGLVSSRPMDDVAAWTSSTFSTAAVTTTSSTLPQTSSNSLPASSSFKPQLLVGMNQMKETGLPSETSSSPPSTAVSTTTTTVLAGFPTAVLTDSNLVGVDDGGGGPATQPPPAQDRPDWANKPWTSNRPAYRPPPTKYPPRPWIFRPKPSSPSQGPDGSTTTTTTTTAAAAGVATDAGSSSSTPTTTTISSTAAAATPGSSLGQTTAVTEPTIWTSSSSTPTPTPAAGGTTAAATATSSPSPATNGSQPATISATAGSQGRYDECGVPRLFPQGRIVGGRDSAFGQFPWQVSVRRTSFFGFSSTHRCGGALINEQWIATAGHCVEDLLPTQIRIRVGEYDFSNVLEVHPFQERAVSKKVVHPKYNFFTYEYDLALVKLEKPVDPMPHVVPICLPGSDDLLIGENATVTGWGRLSEGGTLPSILQNVQVPIVSNDRCKDMFLASGRHEFIPDIFLCAGYEGGGRDSCQGDSGGPLQVKGKDGRMFLAGIISWGIGCAEPNLPGVCTRISKFRDWIIENVT